MKATMYVASEQFASRVLEITNRYSSYNHVTYDPGNFSGKYTRFPGYGDFPETYALRKYGNWWKLTEANYQKPYRITDADPLGVEDFITVCFQNPVIPSRVVVYETYSPGSIVRIWGKLMGRNEKWYLMWEGKPQNCPPEARKFVPGLRPVKTFIDTVRLELNCSQLSHHACFDAILLIGLTGPGSEFQMQCLEALNKPESTPTTNAPPEHNQVNYFDRLPLELRMYIFRFLDLKSLSRCARVNSDWNMLVDDPLLYQNISFREYWQVVDSRIFDFLEKRSEGLRKLDLSWCGKDDSHFPRRLYQFLHWSSYNLTHISLENATYLNGSHLVALCMSCMDLEELRLKNAYISDIEFCLPETISKLNKLVTLDLSGTNITSYLLVLLLKANPNLTYLNLDFCEIGPLDELIMVISEFNRNLKGLSCWKNRWLTSTGANLLGRCHELEDLDLGWCLHEFPEEDTLQGLATGCRGLRRLILSAWRPLIDSMLFPIIEHCTELEQLDLLSITGITPECIERALLRLPKLKFLDLSYCHSISLDRVEDWRIRYPHVTIQRSLGIN